MGIFKAILKKPLDTLESKVEQGGIWKYMAISVDAMETIMRTPKAVTRGMVHVRDALDSKRMMTTVIVALLPALLWALYNSGLNEIAATQDVARDSISAGSALWEGFLNFLPRLIATGVAGGIVEVLFATVRKHEINEGFLVSLFLIPLALPPEIPLWMVAAGTAFGVMFGKEVFGGTGMNFLNPALTARAFIFFSYPGAVSGDFVWVNHGTDAVSQATPLAIAAAAKGDAVQAMAEQGFTLQNMFMGSIPGSVGETSTLAILIGALILIITGVGSWKIMLSTVLGGLAMGALLNGVAPAENAFAHIPPYYHLVMGGFAFGAVFMATDPVSGAATEKGKWIYGFLIGVLAVIIRVLNPAYPEGMMLAILFMNLFAPLIDHYIVESNVKRRLSRAK